MATQKLTNSEKFSFKNIHAAIFLKIWQLSQHSLTKLFRMNEAVFN